MQKPPFKYIKRDIAVSKNGDNRTWQMQNDKHVSVLSVTYDANSSPNVIAALPYVGKPKNHYSFTMNGNIKDDVFTTAAQDVIAHGMLPVLMFDTAARKNEDVILYPANGQERHVAWLLDALKQSSRELGIKVEAVDVQIAEKRIVSGISIHDLDPVDEKITFAAAPSLS